MIWIVSETVDKNIVATMVNSLKSFIRNWKRPSPPLLPILYIILGAIILWQAYSTNKIEQYSLSLAIQEKNIQELSDNTERMEKELRVLKQILSRSKLLEPAVFDTTFTLNGSERDDPFLGGKDSAVVIIAFSEYQCKPCREFFETTFAKLQSNFISSGKIKLIFRDFPLDSHNQSEQAATLANCAGEQGRYWEMHKLLFENQTLVDRGEFSSLQTQISGLNVAKIKECVESNRYRKEIAEDQQDGKRIGIKGAPGFFIGKKNDRGDYKGVIIRGAQPYAVFEAQIERLL